MPDDYTKTSPSPLKTPETLYVRVTVEEFPPLSPSVKRLNCYIPPFLNRRRALLRSRAIQSHPASVPAGTPHDLTSQGRGYVPTQAATSLLSWTISGSFSPSPR